MSTYMNDVKINSDNDLSDDFNYEPISDDEDSLDVTSNNEDVAEVKRIADLMVDDIWNLEFRIDDEACQFYNDDIIRDKDGIIICRQLVCNKERCENMRYLDLDNRTTKTRSITRTKCQARLKVKLDYQCGR
ncbi:hypothetical protein Ahy_B05g074938 [Arachis hypogaea]|uniref:FAR1 domain-containing protein n=1 Tax=Arachis hypogaea TaxID=3818 RepID=A0A444Z046_ARAHY|nr:hypothetical protein Ahy_B05g074938 [Arachis hypogaea]